MMSAAGLPVQPQHVYNTGGAQPCDAETCDRCGVYLGDSDSDTDEEDDDPYADAEEEAYLTGLSENQKAEYFHYYYKRFKKKFRKFVKKGPRKKRNYETHAFALGNFQGRPRPRQSTGGGNPLGKNGQPLECHECQSTQHLAAKCPRRAGKYGKGGGKGGKGTPAASSGGGAGGGQGVFSTGPLAGLVQATGGATGLAGWFGMVVEDEYSPQLEIPSPRDHSTERNNESERQLEQLREMGSRTTRNLTTGTHFSHDFRSVTELLAIDNGRSDEQNLGENYTLSSLMPAQRRPFVQEDWLGLPSATDRAPRLEHGLQAVRNAMNGPPRGRTNFQDDEGRMSSNHQPSYRANTYVLQTLPRVADDDGDHEMDLYGSRHDERHPTTRNIADIVASSSGSQLSDEARQDLDHWTQMPVETRTVGAEAAEVCVVCLVAPVEVTIKPCMHTYFCQHCVDEVQTYDPRCPLCRVPIESAVPAIATARLARLAASQVRANTEMLHTIIQIVRGNTGKVSSTDERKASVTLVLSPPRRRDQGRQEALSSGLNPGLAGLVGISMTQTSRNSEGESQDWFLPTWGSYDEQIKTPGHFHSRPELPAGKTSLLPDTGAHSSLTGDRFAHAQAALAQEHGHASSQNRLPEIRRVRGVGSGSKECEYSCTVPVGLVTTDGEHFVDSFTAPHRE